MKVAIIQGPSVKAGSTGGLVNLLIDTSSSGAAEGRSLD